MPCESPTRSRSDPDAAGLALAAVGGKWKPRILIVLGDRTRRFLELERVLPGISRKVLVQQLRELEADGLVGRRVFEQVPPRVEYSLTASGSRALPVLETLEEFGRSLTAARSTEAGSAPTLAAPRAAVSGA